MFPRFQDAFMYGIRGLVGHSNRNSWRRGLINPSSGHQEISNFSSSPKGLQTVNFLFILHTRADWECVRARQSTIYDSFCKKCSYGSAIAREPIS